MIWSDRRDHMVGDMTPLAGMPSSFVEEARGSLEWSYFPGPEGSVVLQKREKKRHNNITTSTHQY